MRLLFVLCLLPLSTCTVDRRGPADTMVGPGLVLSGNMLGVRFEGSGTADTVARSDHTHAIGPASFRADGIHACEYDPTTNALFWVNYNQAAVMRFDPLTKKIQAIYFETGGANFGTWMLHTTLPTQTTPEIWFGQENSTAVKRVGADTPQFGMSTAHLGDFALPFPPAGVAEAGRDPTGAAGGYSGDKADYFVLQVYNVLHLWNYGGTSTTVLIPDLNAATTAVAPHLANRPMVAYGIEHDPASRQILIGDRDNGLIWVFTYSQPKGPITLKDVVSGPWHNFSCPDASTCYMMRCLAYDDVHKLLWTGNYESGALSAMPFDITAY